MRMCKCSEWRKRCNECGRKITWNSKNMCDECDKGSRCSLDMMNNEKK